MEQQQHTVLVIQRRGRVVTDYKTRQKVCLVQLMFIIQISTKKYGPGCFEVWARLF